MTKVTALTDYRLLGCSGLRVSPLCLGAMTFGTEWGLGADETESCGIFDYYREQGGNFVDTANMYNEGTSEIMLGEFLAGCRDEMVLATKYTLNFRSKDPNAGGNHRKSMVSSVERSLKNLKTDYIDLLWLHIWDQITPIEEVMRALDDLVRSGKILYAGVSDMPAWKVAQANTIAGFRGWTPFCAMQIEYSLIERTPERELMPMGCDLNLGVTPWSPLGGGLLTGKFTREDLQSLENNPDQPVSKGGRGHGAGRLNEANMKIIEAVVAIASEVGATPAQVALRWLLEKPGVTSPIIGARTKNQLQDNLGALGVVLSHEQLEQLDEVSHVELGFPHEFLKNPAVLQRVFGDTKVL